MDKARIQDVTARVAGVNLKTTVRVLRAFSIAAHALGERELSEAVEKVLSEATMNGDQRTELQAKPCREAQEACQAVHDDIAKRISIRHLTRLHSLDGCPYLAAKQVDDLME